MSGVRRAAWIWLLLAIGSSITIGAFNARSNVFTDHRLAPLFEMRDGIPVYTDPNQGPMLSTLYPPLSVLLYAPAILFRHGAGGFFAAGLLAQAFFFAPLALALHFSRSFAGAEARWHGILVFSGFVLWSNLSGVMSNLYLVHADAPALLLSSLSILAFIAYSGRPKTSLIVLAAVFAALAPWAKQTAIPAVFLVPALLAWRKEWKALALYAGVLAGAECAILLVCYQAFDFQQMIIWLILIPAKHPWKGVWSTVLDDALQTLLRENAAALTILLCAFLCSWPAFAGLGEANHREKRTTSGQWIVFGLAGLFFAPTSILGYVKVGGASNCLIFSTYFLNCAVALLVFESLDAGPLRALGTAPLTAAITAFLTVGSMPVAITIVKSILRPSRFLASSNQTAYAAAKANPGVVYFPWHPLTTYLAENRLYHFELGICDRIAAGIEIDRNNFAAHLPPKMEYVAYKGTRPACTLDLLGDYTRVVDYPDLPGWVVLARAENSQAAAR